MRPATRTGARFNVGAVGPDGVQEAVVVLAVGEDLARRLRRDEGLRGRRKGQHGLMQRRAGACKRLNVVRLQTFEFGHGLLESESLFVQIASAPLHDGVDGRGGVGARS